MTTEDARYSVDPIIRPGVELIWLRITFISSIVIACSIIKLAGAGDDSVLVAEPPMVHTFPMDAPDSNALDDLLRRHAPTHRSSFGLISVDPGKKETSQTGVFYLFLSTPESAIIVCTGSLRIAGQTGVLNEIEEVHQPRAQRALELISSDLPDDGGLAWDLSNLRLPGSIPRLDIRELTPDLQTRIVEGESQDLFWSDDWSPDFYRRQAKLGFISTSYNDEGRMMLIPELQKDYAVLDWQSLRPDPAVKRIVKRGIAQELDVRLLIIDDPIPAVEQLNRVWGAKSWLCGPYIDLLKRLSEETSRGIDRNFRLWSVILHAQKAPQPGQGGGTSHRYPAAGELGYSIGKTYTSLSGFFHRGVPEWNNFGKLQLYALADHLKNRGVMFWNLGHPHMDYKTRMGASITPRKRFVQRWNRASTGPAVDLEVSRCTVNIPG